MLFKLKYSISLANTLYVYTNQIVMFPCRWSFLLWSEMQQPCSPSFETSEPTYICGWYNSDSSTQH